MARVRVSFRECIQDSQDYGSTDEHMVSRVWLEIAVDGQERGSYIADLKQTVGSDFESGAIEVGSPTEVGSQLAFRGPFNQAEFAREAAGYFRAIVGSEGRGVRTGSQPLKMRGNRFVAGKIVEFDADSGSAAW